MQNLTKEWLRLLERLKSDEELKKDIEEFKKWCMFTYRNTTYIIWSYDRIFFNTSSSNFSWDIDYFKEKKWVTIFWQANYEHLLRYLNWNGYHCSFWETWELSIFHSDDNFWFFTQFNLKKPLLEQDEEVLSALCDYLETLNN